MAEEALVLVVRVRQAGLPLEPVLPRVSSSLIHRDSRGQRRGFWSGMLWTHIKMPVAPLKLPF
ncbi:hypothetical protein C4E04_01710 [Microvirga sp. 17 mud 1-3]|nr:hypothetical protein C4E04_01710 [Microvirga sp. 17 mud 1-3]